MTTGFFSVVFGVETVRTGVDGVRRHIQDRESLVCLCGWLVPTSSAGPVGTQLTHMLPAEAPWWPDAQRGALAAGAPIGTSL